MGCHDETRCEDQSNLLQGSKDLATVLGRVLEGKCVVSRISLREGQVAHTLRFESTIPAMLLGIALSTVLVLAGEDQTDSQQKHASTRDLASFRPISEVRTDIRMTERELPADRAEQLFTSAADYSREAVNRQEWSNSEVWWSATEFSHQPLYFDDVLLERYGQTPCRLVKPALSGVHFFGAIALLPGKMAADHPCAHLSTLGYHRPGICVEPMRKKLRIQVDPLWLHPRAIFVHH